MWQSLPLVVSDFAIGLVFGVLARQAGLSLMQALLMSNLVFGGGSQLGAHAYVRCQNNAPGRESRT